MPTYEYKCKSCGNHFEQFQSMTDKPLGKCPECIGPVVRLISTGAGIIFKGKGFYQTDYKNSCSKTKNKPDTGSKSPDCSSCPNNQ